jgi:SAM-dependent methyltransferase
MSNYIYDQAWTDERRRLDALCLLYDQGTRQHLTALGVGPGWRCLEVGAGSGTIARWLADRVGEAGRVVATDIDTRFLEPLQEDGLQVRKHDVVRDPLEAGVHDLVHARALLEHLPERDHAIRNLVRALRPGGVLLVEDVILPPPVSDPELPFLGKITNAFAIGFRSVGADPCYGIRLPKALQATGLTDIGAEARVALAHTGTPSIEFQALSLEHLGCKFVAANLLTAEEVQEALAEFRKPGRIVVAPLMVAAWGSAEKG